MSEREELEGPPSRRDPIKTSANAGFGILFGLLAVVILLWPVWLILFGIIIMLGFILLAALANGLARAPEEQRSSIYTISLLISLLPVLVSIVLGAFFILLYRHNRKIKASEQAIKPPSEKIS